MSQEAKKRLEELSNKHTNVYDLTTLLLEYLRQTSDDGSTRHATVQKVLDSWSAELKNGAAADLARKNKYVHDQLGSVMDTIETLRDEMADGT